LFDWINLHVNLAAISAADLVLPLPAKKSHATARAIQTARFEGHGVRTNAEGERLDRIATPDEPGRKLLAQAAEAMRLSAITGCPGSRGQSPIWPVPRR
jgi:magnesium chelatase family protein